MSRAQYRVLSLALFILFGLFTGMVAFAHAEGLRINTTNSFPLGLYRVVHRTPQRGELVLFHTPDTEVFRMAVERGYIHEDWLFGRTPLLKRIVAMEGDVVTANSSGIIINGIHLMYSEPMENDGQGRPLPKVQLTDYYLKYGEIFLMSEHSPFSFDGRYFDIWNTNNAHGVTKIRIFGDVLCSNINTAPQHCKPLELMHLESLCFFNRSLYQLTATARTKILETAPNFCTLLKGNNR